MLFSSMTFIFVFLPIVCALYFLVRNELKNYVLLMSSILFYAWGEPKYLAIMFITIFINYFGARLVDALKDERYRRYALFLTVFADFGFLFYFKYFNFVMENVNALFNANIDIIHVVMPIGISFYTFQAMSYVVDVYHRDVAVQKDVYKLMLYISLFPQLIAGPIVKYHDVAEQIDNRKILPDNVAYGIRRFIVGLAKKVLIANTLGVLVEKVFSQPVDNVDAWTSWMGILGYMFQLFYDFSGYSDMAIGLGSIFGFKFLENFNYPYISKSITEFWRRWHISLSTWFKEYLYIPLGGSRNGVFRTYVNLFLVFLATGVWHGASWNFVMWGVWNAIFIIWEKLVGFDKRECGKFFNAMKHIYAMFVFIVGLVIFRSETLGYSFDYLLNMFGILNHQIAFSHSYYVGRLEIIAFVVGLLCCVPLFKNILHIGKERKLLRVGVDVWLLVLFILSVSSIAASTFNPFIYFRF